MLENYINISHIEALTMLNIGKKYILPVCIDYSTMLSSSINSIKSASKKCDVSVQEELLKETTNSARILKNSLDELDSKLKAACGKKTIIDKSMYYYKTIVPCMDKLRDSVDVLEMIVDKDMWPMPSYGDVLFDVQ